MKKILGLAVAFMVVAVLATPVFAIGPDNAVKNPNIVIEDYGPALRLKNGLTNEWVQGVVPLPNHHMMKDAANFQINNAFVVTDPVSQYYQLENKWAYYDQEMFAQLLYKVFPFPEPFARMIAAMFPEGMYFRWVEVGQ